MPGSNVGYIRVSSKDQNLERQRKEMEKMEIDKIFEDKQSGKDFNRPGYQDLKKYLREGDVLYIHSLDRFGRNREEIAREWREINKDMGVDIVVLDNKDILDTRKYKDSLGNFVAELVLYILSFQAEQERNAIRKRQREGIDIALAAGKAYGRPKMEIDEVFLETYNKWRSHEITAVQAFKALGMSKSTFYKRVREYEAKKPVTS
ncbi:recombinase family protein [Priestia sp. SB1]|uniref:recombinase family protein n=1 Tax=Priestia sp. SB1 TaxID=3132359 RepID=UPI0031749897